MAEDQNVQGTLSVGYDGSKVEQGIKKTAQVVDQQTKEIQKDAKQTEAALTNLGNTTPKRTRAEISRDAESRRLRESEAKKERRLKREARRAARAEMEADAKLQRRVERDLENKFNQERRAFQRQTRKEERAIEREDAMIRNIRNRSMHASTGVQARVLSAVSGPQAATQRRALVSSGMTMQQAFAFQAQAAPGINRQAANFLVTGRGGMPPILGGRTPGGGAGGRGGFLGGLGRFGSSFMGGLGVGVGAMGGLALAHGAMAAVEATKTATAYERQSLAAANLAGNQERLNQLLEAYSQASGGAVARTIALGNVTRLLATGFADSATEVSRFTRGTRGASIALGKPQEYILQEAQLAISNTSVKRLDQIGLGIKEVTDRTEALREENKDWSREMAFQEAVVSLLNEKYGALSLSAEGAATGAEKLSSSWDNAMLKMGQSLKGFVDTMAERLAAQIDATVEAAEQVRHDNRKGFTVGGFGGTVYRPLDNLGITGFDGRTSYPFRPNYAGVFDPNNPTPDPFISPMPSTAPATGPGEDELALRAQYHQAFIDQERNYLVQRGDLIDQYESQRTDIVANYAKMRVREEEDFARQRARAQRDYERSILDVLRESREREADMQEDLDERLGDLREDSNERTAEMQEKYNKDREKAEKDHRDRLMKAAGQLDAIAVLEERKRFAEENREREEAHREAIDEQREALQEQIEEALEAHAEQLEDAREADAKRLEDMRLARERQIADEDEDRAIRLQRMQEDHQDQLDEFDRQHVLRLLQIDENARKEREKMEDEFRKDLHAIDVYIGGYQEYLDKQMEMQTKWFDDFLKRSEAMLAGRNAGGYQYDPETGPQIPTDYAQAFVTSGGGLVKTNVQQAVQNSRTITIQQGAFTIVTTPGFEEMVGGLVEEIVIDILEKN